MKKVYTRPKRIVLICVLLLIAILVAPHVVTQLNIAHAATLIVTPSTLNGWAHGAETGTPTGDFVLGPATPPAGTGSFQFTIGAAVDGYIIGRAAAYNGIRLDQITALSYSTYKAPAGVQTAALQINIDYDLTDADDAWQGRLVYEPYNDPNNTVTANTWQTWNALAGTARFWQTGTPRVGNAVVAQQCPIGSPCTLATLLGHYPNAGFRAADGTLIIKVGSNWATGVYNADNLTITTSTGVDDHFDFETTPEIDVNRTAPSALAITDGVTVDNFGTTTVGTLITHTYEVANVGGSNLLLTTNPPTVPVGFTVTNFGTTTVAGGTNTTFSVSCGATAGAFAGTVQFNNNDADESPFNFDIDCTVNPAPAGGGGGGGGGGDGGGGSSAPRSAIPAAIAACFDSVLVNLTGNGSALAECIRREVSNRPTTPNGLGYASAGYIIRFQGSGSALACFNTNGLPHPVKIGFFDGVQWVVLQEFATPGIHCITFSGNGTLAILTSEGLSFDAPEALFTETPLSNCTVITNAIMNLRGGPGLQFGVLTLVPFGEDGTSLQALARVDVWFRVNFNGQSGWLNSGFLRLRGDCTG